MDRLRLYHGLSAVFGGLAAAWGALGLSSSLTLTAGLFFVAGVGMLVTSVVALARPEFVATDDPSTWKLVVLAIGIVMFVVILAIDVL